MSKSMACKLSTEAGKSAIYITITSSFKKLKSGNFRKGNYFPNPIFRWPIMQTANEIYLQRINQVIDYVNDHLEQSFSLEELAAVACFSPYHFHRIFVALTGESINFFTNRVRLEKAARLLKLSSKSLTTIAMDCGFSSSSTFSRSFKQYFGISPSTYKKSGEIQNDKIKKELFPMEEFLEPMSVEAMQKAFPVKLKEWPERRVAYIRVVNAYAEGLVLEAFSQMIEWAKAKNLYASETIFGMSIDDPMTTPQEKYRYEVCLTLPEDFSLDQDAPMETMILPKCKYATSRVSGDIKVVATATHYLFNHWLINSAYEPEHQHGLEIFLDKEKVCDWNHFELELCIPIKALI